MDSNVRAKLDDHEERIAALEAKVAGASDRVAERLDSKPAERLDLDTLRVPCAVEPKDALLVSAPPSLAALRLAVERQDYPSSVHAIALDVAGARLLARALTQWADDQEGKGS